MKSFKRIANWIRDNKGVATSLIEATATVAVGAVLASVAVSGAIDAINNAKVQAAIGDVTAIGQAVTSFYSDNDFFPLFSDGNKTGAGPTNKFFGFLVSENGTFPTDTSADKQWTITADLSTWGTDSGFFGIQPDYTAATDGSGSDSIENQLIRNMTGVANTGFSGTRLYTLFNSQTGRGWHGPYAATLPKTDPWGDKYIINIRNANAAYLSSSAVTTAFSACATSSNLPSLAVFVISAGPNRALETPVNQCSNTATQVLGDDIVYRIK